MLLFVVRRLFQAIPILLGVSLVVFGLVHIVPGNPIDMLMPPEASPEIIAQMKAAFGFDKPLYVQYFLWLLRAVQGDFGLSVFNATPVWSQLITALANTFVLAILAAILGFAMGIILGMVSAHEPRALARQAVFRDRDGWRVTAALLVRDRSGAGVCRAARLAAGAGHGGRLRCRCTIGWNTSCCRLLPCR